MLYKINIVYDLYLLILNPIHDYSIFNIIPPRQVGSDSKSMFAIA